MAIDFMAIAKGRQLGNAAFNQRMIDQAQEEQFFAGRQERQRKREEADWDRLAAAYTAPLISNSQEAANAGQSDIDFLIKQREVVLNDPAYQAFSPEVKERVLRQLGAATETTAQRYIEAGDSGAARRLFAPWGTKDLIPERNVAFESGDVDAIIRASDTGNLFEAMGDGTYRYKPTGTVIPAARLATALQVGGGAVSAPSIAAELEREAAQKSELSTANIQTYNLSAMTEGYQLQPDGSWFNPLTKATRPSAQVFLSGTYGVQPPAAPTAEIDAALPQLQQRVQAAVAEATARGVAQDKLLEDPLVRQAYAAYADATAEREALRVPATPAQQAAGQIAPTPASPNLGPAVTVATPSAAVTAAPVVPSSPMLQLIDQIDASRGGAPKAQAEVTRLETELQQVQSILDQIAPMQEGSATYAGSYYTPRRVLADPAYAAEFEKLMKEDADLRSQLRGKQHERDDATGALPNLVKQLAAQAAQLPADTPWSAPLMAELVDPVQDAKATKKFAAEQPEAAASMLDAIEKRLAALRVRQLRGGEFDQNAQIEIVKLITARDNLVTVVKKKGGR